MSEHYKINNETENNLTQHSSDTELCVVHNFGDTISYSQIITYTIWLLFIIILIYTSLKYC
jgi:hypothetical protein